MSEVDFLAPITLKFKHPDVVKGTLLYTFHYDEEKDLIGDECRWELLKYETSDGASGYALLTDAMAMIAVGKKETSK